MVIEFGKVEKYIQNRGFGFVYCSFKDSNKSFGMMGNFFPTNSSVFFHIKTIKKYNNEILKRLEEGNFDNLYFWYEIETTEKGECVSKILNDTDDRIRGNPGFSEILQKEWFNLSHELYDWVIWASKSVFNDKQILELKNKRESLRQEKINEQNQLWQNIVQKSQQEIQFKEIQEREFKQLVDEVQSFGFTHSNQVSDYITKNRLGNKYRHLAGVLEMSRGSDAWDFVGGIDPKFYARLCSALNLSSQNSGATPTNFKSFNDLNK